MEKEVFINEKFTLFLKHPHHAKGIMLQFLAGFLFEQFSILSIMFTLVLYALATGLVLFVNSVVNSSFD